MLTMRRWRGPLAAISAVCLIGGGASLALAQDGDGTTQSTSSLDVLATTAVEQVQPDLAGNFAVFRQRPATGMPAEVAKMVGSPTRFGRNPALARAIETPTGTGWVIPGDGYICVAMPDPVDGYGTTCLETDVALRQGVYLTMHGNLPGGKAAELMIVPDGAQAVVTDESGNEQSAATDAGVAAAWTPRPWSLHLKW